jgi:hypothetical protein
MQTSSFSAVPANLFFVSAARQIPHPYCRPAKLRHDTRQSSERAGRPVALRDLKKIQQRLTADAFQPVIEIDLATHALEREPPRINNL